MVVPIMAEILTLPKDEQDAALYRAWKWLFERANAMGPGDERRIRWNACEQLDGARSWLRAARNFEIDKRREAFLCGS